MRRGDRTAPPIQRPECRPDLPPICQRCGHHCPDLRALLNHWTDKHWSGPDSLPRLREQLGEIEARTVNPAVAEGLEVELTLCLQAGLAYHKKRAVELRQKLLRQIGLDCPIHFSCIGWTNHPQGSYRIFLGGGLLAEDVIWPSLAGQEQLMLDSIERVCLEQQARLRPHKGLHPTSGDAWPAGALLSLPILAYQPAHWLGIATVAVWPWSSCPKAAN